MSSDSESDEFEGFSRAELDEAEARFQQQLLLQGIGDNFDGLESDEESDTDVPGPAGDAGNTDGWHDDFLYFERGLPHLFSPTGRTGPTRIMYQDKTPLDFFTLFFDYVLLEMLIQQTDSYAKSFCKLQKENKPDENKMAWVRPTIQEMNAFFGLCFEMGIDRKPSIRMYWSTDSFLQSPLHSKTMSRDRFTQIMRYLHFSDSTQQPLLEIQILTHCIK
ncbi:piggyBac transposable element-derived protein 5-like [Mytilus edulis]|uniref:piggyBac transposable element-derived protein 5-like n=1 Tax=Mytilus edulis TaxID=6550 RepID=UPI0039EE9956